MIADVIGFKEFFKYIVFYITFIISQSYCRWIFKTGGALLNENNSENVKNVKSIIKAIVCVNIQGDKNKMPKLAHWQTAKSKQYSIMEWT